MKRRILELDALRGIAALSVVVFHFTLYRASAGGYVFNLGCVGVDLFFIISGFVIFMTLERCKHWSDFIVSRFSRLYPTYWACVSITFLAYLLSNTPMQFEPYEITHNAVLKYVANLSMLQYYVKVGNIDGPYWTLVIELVFYFFMFLLLFGGQTKRAEHFGAGFLAVVILHNLFFSFIEQHRVLHATRLAVPLLSYFPLFFSGMLIYKVRFDKPSLVRVLLLFASFATQLFLYENCYQNQKFVSFTEYCAALSFIYLVFALYLFNRLGFIVNKTTTWLGTISYSLYLIHQFVGCNVLISGFEQMGLGFWLAAGLALLIVLWLAHLITHYIEAPALQYIRNRYKQYRLQNAA